MKALRAAIEQLEPRCLLSTVTWCGSAGGLGGDNVSWNSGKNWIGGLVPTSTQTAYFGSEGTTGQTIQLKQNETVSLLEIDTANAFTISDTFTLSLAGLTQTTNTTTAHTIAVPIQLTRTSSTWSVDGSTLTVSKAIGGAGDSLIKTGAAELDFTTATSGWYTGNTTVSSGTLRATANGTINGNLTVGDGTSSATFIVGSSASSVINSTSTVTVNNNASVLENCTRVSPR